MLARGNRVYGVSYPRGIGGCCRRQCEDCSGDSDADGRETDPDVRDIEWRIEHGVSGCPMTDKRRGESSDQADHDEIRHRINDGGHGERTPHSGTHQRAIEATGEACRKGRQDDGTG
jgi:hypothetical protein